VLIVGAVGLWKLIGGGTKTVDKPPVVPTAATAAPTSAPLPVATVEPVVTAGVMHVETSPPGATIFLDGESKGAAPVDVTGVALGAHQVRAELIGYDPKTESIELTAEAPESKLVLALATPPPQSATVDITSTPSGASISIDGKPAGTTPLSGVSLKAGTHRFELRKEGFDPFMTSARVMGGKPRRIEATLVAQAKPTLPPSTPKPEVVDAERVYEEDQVETAPKKAKGDSPSYPDKAPKLRSGDSVSVQVSWIVTETGETTDFKIVGSGGKVVDDAVVETLRKQRFKPGLKMGKPVKVRLTRTYIFRAG
jgi:TonB family protein